MVKIYSVVILLLQMAANTAFAGNPFKEGDLLSSLLSQTGLHNAGITLTTGATCRTASMSYSSSISNNFVQQVPIAKGMKSANRFHDAFDNSFVSYDTPISLNLHPQGRSAESAFIGLANFVNSLSRIMARYTFSPACNMYTKLILTDRTAHIGLNF